MFDAQCDLAALVYDQGDDPDAVLRDFAAEVNAQGFRAVGLVQRGRHCSDVNDIAAVLIHNGMELPLLQDLGPCASGCRLDAGLLLDAGAQVGRALSEGADLLVINRFGKQERNGKGLLHLIEQALTADIPVVIAVPRHRFLEWIAFVEGMSVRLSCDRPALIAWWHGISAPYARLFDERQLTVCEVLK